MREGDALPVSPVTASLIEAIVEMSRKGMGMTVIVDHERRVAGVFTDGDLRRCVSASAIWRAVPAVMTRTPRTVRRGRACGRLRGDHGDGP